MKIFTTSTVRELDKYTIEHEPLKSIDLMERAARAFTLWFLKGFDSSKPIFIFCGPGNNGGDGFAVARLLTERKFNVTVLWIKFTDKLSRDGKMNLERFSKISPDNLVPIESTGDLPEIPCHSIIIDAIFGSGLSRPAEGLAAEIIHQINSSDAYKISIDIPSGLFGEDNRDNNLENIVKADETVSFQFPFLSFFFSENYLFTGAWSVVPIGLHPKAIRETISNYELISSFLVRSLLHKREKFSHKGSYGHALIIAGCYGMMGASVLTTTACLRTGAGLVTAHIPRFGYDILQTSIPEALISMDASDIMFTEPPDLKSFNAIGVGPGLSCRPNSGKGIFSLLTKVDKPLVVDADGLNIISSNPEWLKLLPENTIITPHPKEFDRLAGESASGLERHQKQLEFASKYKLIVVLKGANTFVTLPNGKSWINNSGNPGMATGGSGDVLTGMLVSLLAQSYSPEEAAVLGVYLHGLAADLALEAGQSMESLLAGDIIDYIGKAFNHTRLQKTGSSDFIY